MVGKGKTKVARRAQHRIAVIEKFFQYVRCVQHGEDIFLARTFIPAQQMYAATVLMRASFQQYLR